MCITTRRGGLTAETKTPSDKLTSGTEISLVPRNTSSSERSEGDIDTVYLYLDVEWISDLDTDNDGTYENGDGFDAWAGNWVKGFSFDITIEAYQAS